jgi:hypothetical protein
MSRTQRKPATRMHGVQTSFRLRPLARTESGRAETHGQKPSGTQFHAAPSEPGCAGPESVVALPASLRTRRVRSDVRPANRPGTRVRHRGVRLYEVSTHTLRSC